VRVDQKLPILCANYDRLTDLPQSGKNCSGHDQVILSDFDVFGDIVYEAAPSGTQKPITDGELIAPARPAKKHHFCRGCDDESTDINRPDAPKPRPRWGLEGARESICIKK
jgi:hypothetical protein